jgi:DNA topoisomerase I
MVTLYPHQRRVVDDFVVHGCRAKLCVHSTGSGKTLIAAALVRGLRPRHTLVLTKKSAIAQFTNEIYRLNPRSAAPSILVTTHHTYWRQGLPSSSSLPRSSSTCLLVVDEAHEFNNPDTASYARLQALLPRFTHVLFLTATPITNKVEDLAVLVGLLRRDSRVALFDGETGKLNAAALSSRVGGGGGGRCWLVDVHLIDKDKDPRFPKTTVHEVTIPMSKATSEEYGRQLQKVAPFYVNLRQLSLGVGSKCEKCKWLVDKAKEWISRGEGKIVVYTAYIDRGAKVIKRALLDAGINTLVITGETSGKERRNAAVLFNRKPSDEVLSIDMRRRGSMGVGIDQEEVGEGSSGTWAKSVRCKKVLCIRTATRVDGGDASRPAFVYEYRRPDGSGASHEEIAYVESLRIPPPWTPAEICVPNKKLLWVAKDKTGKWQYRYSTHWIAQQEFKKMLRLRMLDSTKYSAIQRRIREDLANHPPSAQAFQCALVVRLMSLCHFRVGGRAGGVAVAGGAGGVAVAGGAGRSGSIGSRSGSSPGLGGTVRTARTVDDESSATFGVTTMLKKHLTWAKGEGEGKSVEIRFLGKARKWNVCTVCKDPVLKYLRMQVKSSPRTQARIFTINAPHVRAYLRSITTADRSPPGPSHRSAARTHHHPLTPKDFRTYAANLAVLSHLASTNPMTMKPAARRRAVAEAIRLAARGLNNTPAVAKSSYVFPGFWVLYLANPLRFRELANAGKDSAAAILDRFVAEFDSKQLDWRLMLEWFQNTKGLLPFMGPVQVLLISDAGSESIDLAGTRHIVFLDPTWTPALEDQIIGRGQRSESHAFLSPSRRTLSVWKLSLKRKKEKKGGTVGGGDGIQGGIDEFVYKMAARKRKEFVGVYEKLERITARRRTK